MSEGGGRGGPALVSSLGAGHVVFVEESLPLGEAAHYNVLVLLRHLSLHLHLQPTQQERPEHLPQGRRNEELTLELKHDHLQRLERQGLSVGH